jgi:hypothetical protein
VTTTFAEPAVRPDRARRPGGLGDAVDGRQLLLGLDGAERARDANDSSTPRCC